MKRKKKSRNSFSLDTIRRMSLYLRNLKEIREEGLNVISSNKITRLLNVTPAQFRKDLSYFGGFGKRGVGYNIEKLIQEIERILGADKKWKIVLVGVGKLGSALLGFEGFSKFNIKITHAFDVDTSKINQVLNGIKISDVRNMPVVVRDNNIKIAIVSTSPEAAQQTADSLVGAGIRSILNFAPAILRVPERVWVSNVDMASELETLIFFSKKHYL